METNIEDWKDYLPKLTTDSAKLLYLLYYLYTINEINVSQKRYLKQLVLYNNDSIISLLKTLSKTENLTNFISSIKSLLDKRKSFSSSSNSKNNNNRNFININENAAQQTKTLVNIREQLEKENNKRESLNQGGEGIANISGLNYEENNNNQYDDFDLGSPVAIIRDERNNKKKKKKK